MGPREHRRAQIDGRSLQRIECVQGLGRDPSPHTVSWLGRSAIGALKMALGETDVTQDPAAHRAVRLHLRRESAESGAHAMSCEPTPCDASMNNRATAPSSMPPASPERSSTSACSTNSLRRSLSVLPSDGMMREVSRSVYDRLRIRRASTEPSGRHRGRQVVAWRGSSRPLSTPPRPNFGGVLEGVLGSGIHLNYSFP